MPVPRTAMPVWRIALYGFLLNMLWEFVQCTVLYDMWSWGLWRGTAWMWGGIAGDVVIVLGVVGLSRLAVGAGPLLDLSLKGWVALLGVGFVASVALEWAARALGLWGYTSWMPTLTIGGRAVGLSPIAQVTALPALSVALALRRESDATPQP